MALTSVGFCVCAGELGDRFPAGSIGDREQAQAALQAADAEEARMTREFAAREAECYRAFLVNRCREKVRSERIQAERELNRIRVEAHDLERKLDADEAARRRAEAAAEKAPRSGRPDTPEPRSETRPQPREVEPRASSRLSPEEEARNRADYEKRIADRQREAAREQAQAAERAANAREYEQKQAEARKRAEESAAAAKRNQERRAERRRQLETSEAEREEIRRKAEEAARAAK